MEKCWCNNLSSVSVATGDNENFNEEGNELFRLRILSFNVLAEAFLNPRSHKQLPEEYAAVVFDRTKRRKLLMETLISLTSTKPRSSAKSHGSCPSYGLSYDVLCLQEADPFEECVVEALKEGFDFCHSKVLTRTDRCAIFWRKDAYELVESQTVEFDDLAQILVDNDNKNSKSNNAMMALKGMSTSFLRSNTAVVAVLRHKKSNQKFVVSSTHLFWNPGFEYVKLAQTKLLLDRVNELSRKHNKILSSSTGEAGPITQKIPVFCCGDFNSKPGSAVHTFISKGRIDARTVAPWRQLTDERETSSSTVTFDGGVNNNNNTIKDYDSLNNSRTSGYTSGNQERNAIIRENQELREKLRALSLSLRKESKKSNLVRPVKYMLDYTLNRLTRWLRTLGLDASLETEEEENERTRKGPKRIHIFDHCRNEGRVLVTTSTTLLQRKDCPPGAYLVDPNQLEKSLCHLLLLHGTVLKPEEFITRCIVCNGCIVQIKDPVLRDEVLNANKVPLAQVNGYLSNIFACDFCLQSYWWSDNPNSSSSRVKNTAVQLFTLTLRAGIPIEGGLGLFSYVDVEAERKKGGGEEILSKKTITDLSSFPRIQALEWLNDSNLKHSFLLKSAYAVPRDDNNINNVDGNKNGIANDIETTHDVVAGDNNTDDEVKKGNDLGSDNDNETDNKSNEEDWTTTSIDEETLPFTNVTSDFVGTLDYIFYDKQIMPCNVKLLERLDIPTTFPRMNCIGGQYGHLIPSKCWPSDHLAIGATFAIEECTNQELNRRLKQVLKI